MRLSSPLLTQPVTLPPHARRPAIHAARASPQTGLAPHTCHPRVNGSQCKHDVKASTFLFIRQQLHC